MNAVQFCARCGAQWPVHGAPMQWCPRCRGVLLAPAAPNAPAQRRQYRWVARRPAAAIPDRPLSRPQGPRPTPRYFDTPRWGLLDPPPPAPPGKKAGLAGFAERAVPLLGAASILFGLAAAAELGRYLILLRNRTRLIDPLLLALSDSAVWATSFLALAVALAGAIAAIGWLVEARKRSFARQDRSDPRSTRTLVLGCAIPFVNLVLPGVFVTEFTRESPPRTRKLIRVWWWSWVLSGVLVVVAQIWRTADSLQVQADGVLFTAFTNLLAAAVGFLTIMVIRDVDGHDVLGRRRVAKRWLIATGPARPVIEPIRPAGAREQDAEQDTAQEQQEVMAK